MYGFIVIVAAVFAVPCISTNDTTATCASITLEQNSPNPFNPHLEQTTIEFCIPVTCDSQRVVLNIFNVVGQHVATLVDRRMGPGKYCIAWDGRSSNGDYVPSGIFFYTLQMPRFAKTLKLVAVAP